jgi:transcriptional regulator with XRE-family HTH domain
MTKLRSESIFATRVLERAAQLGLTKKDLAAKARLSRQTLDNVLRLGSKGDDLIPSVKTLLCLSVALRVHPFWLTDGIFEDHRLSAHLKAQMRGDRAGFVSDVACADGCLVAPGARFQKVWSAQFLGSANLAGRKVVCADDQIDPGAFELDGRPCAIRLLTSQVREVCVEGAAPTQGSVVTITIEFTAPLEPGPAFSYWLVAEADGKFCYSESAGLWVIVYVEPDALVRSAFPGAFTTAEYTHGPSGIQIG